MTRSNSGPQAFPVVHGKTASDQASFEFEMAYQMRVASDRILFAIRALDTIFPGKITDISVQLVEALERLQRTDQRFQRRWNQRSPQAREESGEL